MVSRSITSDRSAARSSVGLIGALALRAETYEEVEADPGATGQAVAVVVPVERGGRTRSARVRRRRRWRRRVLRHRRAHGLGGVGPGSVRNWRPHSPGAQTRADVGQLLRTTGFATAPGLLRVAGIMPELTIPSFAVAALWMLLAMIVAVRQALDYTSTRRAIAVCGLGWVLAIALAVLFGIWFGPRVS